jgi:thioredoxin reductase (NADPH)
MQDAGIPAMVLDKSCLVSAIANYPTNLVFFSTPEKLVIGGVPFTPAGFRPTRAEGLEYYRRVTAGRRLSVQLRTRVTRIERGDEGLFVRVESEGAPSGRLKARAVVVATGYFDYPNMLGVPGEDLPHVSHRFVDGHAAFQRDALVVGGGNSAAEAAIDLARCGARVRLVHYESGFVTHTIKPWIMPEFDRLVASGAIRLHFNARVKSIDPLGVRVDSADGARDYPADFVYLMTGYTPQPGLLGELGVPFHPETGAPEHNPETMETPIPNIFVAGVMTSGYKANGVFIENGRGHGALIAAALASR